MQRNFDNPEDLGIPSFYRDDYFLPIRPRRDSDGFTSDSIDDRSDHNESGAARVRANTYDCVNLQIPKFKADNSWISSHPFSIGESSTDPDDKDLTPEDDMTGFKPPDVSNTHIILAPNPPLARTSVNINISDCLNVERTSHCENNSNSSSMRASAKGLKVMPTDIKGVPLQQMAKADAADQSSEVPEPYIKESIPWHPGTVRQQWRNLEERIKSNTKAPGEAELVDDDVPVAADVVDSSSPPAAVSTSASSLTTSEACPSSENEFLSSHTIWMTRSPFVLKSSHTISTFPVNKESEAVTVGREENEFDAGALHKVAERPQSVCDDVLLKELLNSLSLKGNLTADKDSCSLAVYKMEDIDIPVGTVRRTTQELEQKHRYVTHPSLSLPLSFPAPSPSPSPLPYLSTSLSLYFPISLPPHLPLSSPSLSLPSHPSLLICTSIICYFLHLFVLLKTNT